MRSADACAIPARATRLSATCDWGESMNTMPNMPFMSRHPELGDGPIPVEPYLSEAYYEQEI